MTDFEKYGVLANDMYEAHNLAAINLNEWKTISSIHKNGKGTKLRHIQKMRYCLADLEKLIAQDRVLTTEAFACELYGLIETVKLILNDTYSKVEWKKDYITLEKSNGIATVSFPAIDNHPVPIYGATFRTIENITYLSFQSEGFEIMMVVGFYEDCFNLDGCSINYDPEISAEESYNIITGLNTEDPTEHGYEFDNSGNYVTYIGDLASLRKHFNGNVILSTFRDPFPYKVSMVQRIEAEECIGLVFTLEANEDLKIFIPTAEVVE